MIAHCGVLSCIGISTFNSSTYVVLEVSVKFGISAAYWEYPIELKAKMIKI